MSLKERSYSVLLVSSSEKFNESVVSLLRESGCSPLLTVSSISSAKRVISERAFDCVIINSPLPDNTGERFAIDICECRGTVVLIMVRSELHAEVYGKVAPYGVFTLSKPVSRPLFLTAVGWLGSARERLRRSEAKNLSIQDKMEEIRIVNRAKWLLISHLKMDEEQAHRYIERQAMDRCVTKRTVAEDIIKTYT